MALFGQARAGVHNLDGWTMTEDGKDLLLTLETPEGVATSVTLKPWQVEGMATIATYGSSQRIPPKTMHGNSLSIDSVSRPAGQGVIALLRFLTCGEKFMRQRASIFHR